MKSKESTDRFLYLYKYNQRLIFHSFKVRSNQPRRLVDDNQESSECRRQGTHGRRVDDNNPD